MWGKTLNCDDFHRVTNTTLNYMVFASQIQLEALSQATTLFGDGTFHCVPYPFGRLTGAQQGQVIT